MKLVQRKDIDEKLWATWCETSSVFSPFSRLEYLDAVAENLTFLINDHETGGLALPYLERFGVKTLYTPVFCRWIKWVGENQPSEKEITAFVQLHFKQAEIYTQAALFTGNKKDLIYQIVDSANFALNSQVKRKLKKASQEEWQISWNQPVEKAIEIIESSLKNKFETLEDSSFSKLERLAINLSEANLLKVISLLSKEGKLLGSLLLIVDKKQCLYLKGACEESVKMAGGMYYLMNEAINFAIENDMNFDFGGSRIPGVRKFNLSFGSSDQTYFHSSWDKGPIWYSSLKKFRQLLKK